MTTTPLRALALTCTLNRSPAALSSQLLADQFLEALAGHGVEGTSIRVVDHDVKPGVELDMGDGDEWPTATVDRVAREDDRRFACAVGQEGNGLPVMTRERTDPPSSPGAAPAPPEESGPRRFGRPRASRSKGTHTRLSATWTAVVVAVVVLIFLVIFIAQNTQDAEVNYLGAHGHASTAVVILIAALAGAIIVIVVAGARLLQVRRRTRRTSRASDGPSPVPTPNRAAGPSPQTESSPPADASADQGSAADPDLR